MEPYLIQILLPLSDNQGRPFAKAEYVRVREKLTRPFGGLTAFTRSPAKGFWQEGSCTSHDDIVVFEVMAEVRDPVWWAKYRQELETSFRQDSVVVRAQPIQFL